MHTQLKADLMLVLVTFFWGISYLLTDLALTEVCLLYTSDAADEL